MRVKGASARVRKVPVRACARCLCACVRPCVCASAGGRVDVKGASARVRKGRGIDRNGMRERDEGGSPQPEVSGGIQLAKK